jgi:CheY-like chemotaxis protein
MADKEIQGYNSSDPESQENQVAYHDLLESIEKRMDPDSNSVLVVDDEVGIRKLVSRNLRKNNKNVLVFEAGNGQEGLDTLQKIRQEYNKDPLFIVTDLNMPVMDGWTFIEQLRKEYEKAGHTQGIPIIVLSSTSGEKGHVFFKKTVHGGKSGYNPLVAIAKETCLESTKYDAVGEKGLDVWMRHFLRYS